MEEITATARRLLVEQGPEAASLRAIAREMGMTAPGLYRYFSSRDMLLRSVVAQMYSELATVIHQAIQEAVPLGPPPADEDERRKRLTVKMIAACSEFRRWSLAHQQEFALLFGVPLPGFDDGRFDTADECALEFAGAFYALFLELWHSVHFPIPAEAEIDPRLFPQLSRFRDILRTDAPEGAILTFLRCWMLLYGAVSMEVFGHLHFALGDPGPMFDITLSDLARLVGLDYRPWEA
jgi:AcrR family transcriptional regulator